MFINFSSSELFNGWIGHYPTFQADPAKKRDFLSYTQTADWVSFDLYPVSGYKIAQLTDLTDPKRIPNEPVAPGGSNIGYFLDQIRRMAGQKKSLFNYIECSNFTGQGMPSGSQVRGEIWTSIINGAKGLFYFCHPFGLTNDTGPWDIELAMETENAVINRHSELFASEGTITKEAVPFEGREIPFEGHQYKILLNLSPGSQRYGSSDIFYPYQVKFYKDGVETAL